MWAELWGCFYSVELNATTDIIIMIGGEFKCPMKTNLQVQRTLHPDTECVILVKTRLQIVHLSLMF